MARKSVLHFDRPGIFTSTRLRRVLDDSGAVSKKNFQELADTNVASTASFRYDPPFLGLRSTQQIPVDFSKFENHTFFNSAEVNVNVAFDRIINGYPFDGSRRELEAFLDSLTGFEKWVLDSFPTNVGYLNFSGSTGLTAGTYITVNDFAGSTIPNVSRDTTGNNILNPGMQPLTIELQLFIPEQINDNQVVCQKMSGSAQGITLALLSSASPASCSIVFGAISGASDIHVKTDVLKGQFNHIVATFDRRSKSNKMQLYVNEKLVEESDGAVEMSALDFAFSPLIIGSGSRHDRFMSSGIFTPISTFSGSIDEFRLFHGVRTIRQQELYANKPIWPTPDLKLYFKFNEPSGSIGTDDIVLDSSGKSLHSRITNYNSAITNSQLLLSLHPRATGSLPIALQHERVSQHPILFPAFNDVRVLNSRLLASASAYDAQNMNLITRLVPNHYLREGQFFEALTEEEGTIVDGIDGQGPPGSSLLGSSQLMASFLYVWAKFFDEIKMFIDLFGNTLHVDYDKPNTIADQMLPFLAKYYGFEMPAFFINSSIEQFIDAENISHDVSTNAVSLRYVQNQIWRRILTNIGEIIQSKGTLHSIKALFRSMGIEPDASFRIREFGGPTVRSLEDSRDTRADITTFVDFSGSLAENATMKPLLMSPFLIDSAVHDEPGFPARATVTTTIAGAKQDSMFTSGSWMYEALYRFPFMFSGSHHVSQSLVRMVTTGTSGASLGSGGLIMNLLTVSGSNVTLFARPTDLAGAPILELALTGTNVMDGRIWNVSFGRNRNDEIGSHASASYFLRAARSEFGNIIESHLTSTFYKASNPGDDLLQTLDPNVNRSGVALLIGSQSITLSASMLNDGVSVNDFARWTEFSGHVGQLRFWSRALEDHEWLEHVRNPRSLGVEDPLTNFNFVRTATGSFGRLRIDCSAEQPGSMSNGAGQFELFDFSQNNLHLTGTGFEANEKILIPERIFFSQLSPRFDEASTNNKVRVRSFQSFKNVQLYGGQIAPVYEIPREEQPNDDIRFSIDFSIMDALNEDIIRIFSSLDSFDNILGDPELIFSPDYPKLEELSDVYFNRLTDKVRLKQFFEFFKWFDSVLGISSLVEQLVPRKSRFLGTNFVIESHMLERPKFEYLFTDIYLGENDRAGLKGVILLQQFSSILKRY